MSNITPSTPSFVFSYWRPWKENSNFFDSYLNYAKDVSLVKYGADTVGNYINQASKEQIKAINQLGQAMGRGMNVLSNQMSDINRNIGFLNRNMDIQIEQQKLSNLLLKNIAELLRVPDSEKQRQLFIEKGIKHFVNAGKNPDLYEDSLKNLLKAEELSEDDYFVLHRIGCIYLYVDNFINPEKALEYFLKSAKYASVDSESNAIKYFNALTVNIDQEKTNELESELYEYAENVSFDEIPNLRDSEYDGLFLDEHTYKLYTVNYDIEDGNDCEDDEKKYLIDLISDSSVDDLVKNELSKIQNEVSSIISKYGFINNNTNSINVLAADSYEKAAFSSYILGQFEKAETYQTRALSYNSTPENRFLLSKYQVRNGNNIEAIENLNKAIDNAPYIALAVFKEIDLFNEPEVIKLLEKKNEDINEKVNQLVEKWKTVESNTAAKVISELTELSDKSYEIKIAEYTKFKSDAISINKKVHNLEYNIDLLINEIQEATFTTFDKNNINEIIKNLQDSKELPIEKSQTIYDKYKEEYQTDKLQIGSIYAGGIVFFLDDTGKHGLVCADKNFGERVVWGGRGEIGAMGNGIADGTGMQNTKKIVELASWFIEKGIFRSTKKPAPTAARMCLESNYNGFNDWYLPTKAELSALFANLRQLGVDWEKWSGCFALSCWSSTEYDARFAWGPWKIIGEQYSNNKDDKYNVRAVRAF